MIYFNTKSDLEFMMKYKSNVHRLWDLENEIRKNIKPTLEFQDTEYFEAIAHKVNQKPEGRKIRERIAKTTPKAIEIARKNNTEIDAQSFPAPAVGGPVIPINLFSAILHDNSHGSIDKMYIEDAINETIGQLENRLKKEHLQIFNPLYWFYSLLIFFIRIPFHLIAASGFNISKIEDHFWGRFFKFIEIIVIIYILLKLGVEKTELIELLKSII